MDRLTANSAGSLVLARGPWEVGEVLAEWTEQEFEPDAEQAAAADAAIERLRSQGSPSHDGIAGRLAGYSADAGRLKLQIQPSRWALRLDPRDAAASIAALCVIRSADGRWLAGRRAGWVATWAGRWSLGAGGAVDAYESPCETLLRESREEWSISPDRVRCEALIELPQRMVMFVGQAWLAEGDAERVTPDHEHDHFAWWPAEIERWPDEAETPLRMLAQMIA